MKEDDEQFEDKEGFPLPDDLNNIFQNSHSEQPDSDTPEELTSEIENRQPRKLEEKEVKVLGVFEHQEQGMSPGAFVLLRDNQGRQVVIWIGRFEAYAISVALEGATYDRPMTHDLLSIIVDRLGGKVERITIDDLWQETYYAKITIATDSQVLDIDSRPSDAIALALRAKAPIYMAESVLQQSAANEDR